MVIASLWVNTQQYLQIMIGYFMPFIMRRSLRQGLHAIWQKGNWKDLSQEGLIFASNHPSWWDMYVCWWIGKKLGRDFSGIFRNETLETFPFFRSIGGIGHSEIREALRRLKQGHILQFFPSGDMQYGFIKNSHEGIAFLAEKSKSPVYPVALRVVMRGAQKSEVFVMLGEKLEYSGNRTEFVSELEQRIKAMLENLEKQLCDTHPEARPEGFESWLEPALRFDQKIAKFKDFWSRRG